MAEAKGRRALIPKDDGFKGSFIDALVRGLNHADPRDCPLTDARTKGENYSTCPMSWDKQDPATSKACSVCSAILVQWSISKDVSVQTQPKPQRTINLSPLEQIEVLDRGFLSRKRVNITGYRQRQRNIVEVDGISVPLSDAPFRLLLRLVAVLYENNDGFVLMGTEMGRGGLAAEGFYHEDGVHQAIERP
jgi:hypothetical protein